MAFTDTTSLRKRRKAPSPIRVLLDEAPGLVLHSGLALALLTGGLLVVGSLT